MTQVTGLHSRAEGGPLDAFDASLIKLADGRLNGFKFTTSDARQNHALIKSLGIPMDNCFVRLYWDCAGFSELPTPLEFAGWFKTPIREAIEDGIVWFEFLNEVNLPQEWKWTALEFTNFARTVIGIFRQWFPKAKFISPGLSPTVNTPAWDALFASSGFYAFCDGIGVHAYGRQAVDLNNDDELRYYRRFAKRLSGSQQIWITEASFKFYQGGMKSYDVGLLYGKYATTLEAYVRGVWFFVLSGDQFINSGEAWRNFPDIPRGLGDYQIPITPPPTNDEVFVCWRDSNTGEIVSYDNPALLTADSSRTLVAVTAPAGKKVLTLLTKNSGTVEGGGWHEVGTEYQVKWSAT